MGVFDFLKPKPSQDRYVSETSYHKNKNGQMIATSNTLKHLRDYKVSNETILKLEFFFYTNNLEKAKLLAEQLKNRNYMADFGISGRNKKEFIITGWTNKMLMTDEVVLNWTAEMCDVGYQFDCFFDGWGTNPEQ